MAWAVGIEPTQQVLETRSPALEHAPIETTRQSVLASRGMARLSSQLSPSLLYHLVPLSVLADMVEATVLTEIDLKISVRVTSFYFCVVPGGVSPLSLALSGESVTLFELQKGVGGWSLCSPPSTA